MKIDRELQRALLIALRAHYPYDRPYEEMRDVFNNLYPGSEYIGPLTDHPIDGNLHYLEELDLVANTQLRNRFRITAKGIDFLEGDGGLSAILNVVTVKFDADNIRSLVEAGVLKAGLPEEKQGAIRKALAEAPANVLQALSTKLIEKALSDPMASVKTVAGVLGIIL